MVGISKSIHSNIFRGRWPAAKNMMDKIAAIETASFERLKISLMPPILASVYLKGKYDSCF